MYKFTIRKDKAGEFKVDFTRPNGEVMFSSKGYVTKSAALSLVDQIKANAVSAEVDDQTE